MKKYKLTGVALRDYNDTKRKITIEKDEPVTEERARYEELYSKGLVSEGKIVEDIAPRKLKMEEDKIEDIKL